jgi:hypothetical protein
MKRGLPCDSSADVLGVEAVDVLLGGDGFEHLVSSKCFGRGSCTRMPCTDGSALSSAILPSTSAGSRVGGTRTQRVDAGLLAGGDLVAHVDGRGRVAADQDHRQAGLGALGGEFSRALAELDSRSFAERALPSMMVVKAEPGGSAE